MSTEAELRTLAQLKAEAVRLATAGMPPSDTRDRMAGWITGIVSEAHALGRQEAGGNESRESLVKAWSAWLDLAMSVSLPGAEGASVLQEVLEHDPELRQQFKAFLSGEGRG